MQQMTFTIIIILRNVLRNRAMDEPANYTCVKQADDVGSS